MKWTNEEIKMCVELLQQGLTYNQISKEIKRSEGSVRNKLNEHGYRYGDYNTSVIKFKCLECGGEFEDVRSHKRKFCSHKCSILYNNKIRGLKTREINCKCLNCNNDIPNGGKYCNIVCQVAYDQKKYIEKWKRGEVNGTKGLDSVSNYVRNYLYDKYDNKCCKCGWNERNPSTNLIPLQIHHIDGDCKNNNESNLELLCPNCHSLTKTFGSLNYGKSSRMYIKSYRNKT